MAQHLSLWQGILILLVVPMWAVAWWIVVQLEVEVEVELQVVLERAVGCAGHEEPCAAST